MLQLLTLIVILVMLSVNVNVLNGFASGSVIDFVMLNDFLSGSLIGHDCVAFDAPISINHQPTVD